jgi:pimeloyl-ACP methyl ester carboxylesterase
MRVTQVTLEIFPLHATHDSGEGLGLTHLEAQMSGGLTRPRVSARTKAWGATALAVALTSSWFTLNAPWAALFLEVEYARAGLTRRSIEHSGRKYVYLEGGRGTPVVLLHGFGGSKDNWIQFAGNLTKSHRVIVLDLPGFGDSPALERDTFDIEAQAKRVRDVLASMGARPAHLVGNSMGGQIAADIASRWPGDVLTLTMIEPHGLASAEITPFEASIRRGDVPLIVRHAEGYERFLDLVFVKRPYLPGPIHRALRAQMIARAALWTRIWNEVRPDATRLGGLLARIQAPTLILWGDSDRVFPRSAIPALERGLARHQTLVLPGCGHAAMMEQPDIAAARWLRFVAQADSAR